MDATPNIVITLNGVDHPIHLDEVTARQVMLVRQRFGMAPRIFPRLVETEAVARKAGRDPHSVVDTPEVAAMVYLSRLQVEGPTVSVDDVLDAVKVGADVQIEMPALIPSGEVADLDPPA